MALFCVDFNNNKEQGNKMDFVSILFLLAAIPWLYFRLRTSYYKKKLNGLIPSGGDIDGTINSITLNYYLKQLEENEHLDTIDLDKELLKLDAAGADGKGRINESWF